MEKHSEESSDPLLRQSAEEESSIYSTSNPPSDFGDGRRRIYAWLREHAVSIATISLLFYIAVALTVDIAIRAAQQPPEPLGKIISLVSDSLQFEERKEWYPPDAPWTLGPSDELDAAWEDLLYAIDIRVTGDELDTLGVNMTNRVQVNGGDYLGSIGVYHHLHCLNNLRMIVHWDYYEPKFADSEYLEHMGTEHSDHCINSLRQAVMCHANTAISTFEWVDEENLLQGKEQRLEGSTTCANWESLDGWARQRTLVSGNYTYRPGPFAANKAKDMDVE
ncbi:uncharacterized protein GGS25DRAFT_510192 [Hypoxylon fragiforme]|uniref:uncharacterized protein n=1 Tax=Hypoxylon fragiforme TaxID=63214 RepID=UPI0020C6C98B|nr:uncharacterized protein GGS25DRAFT_510192 [Hypoxylon fragiforme]KAI2603139.1 hypothetical protein GGS25DRAFT_510192 [Hypoxylon fragiforme]